MTNAGPSPPSITPARPGRALGTLTRVLEFYPCRCVITRPLPATHVAINVGAGQSACDCGIDEQVVDAQTRVSRIGVPKIIPEGVNPLARMKRAQRVGPALFRQRMKGSPHFGAKKSIVEPAFRLVDVQLPSHYVVAA